MLGNAPFALVSNAVGHMLLLAFNLFLVGLPRIVLDSQKISICFSVDFGNFLNVCTDYIQISFVKSVNFSCIVHN